mgnify:CR=1 FL=1
MIKVKQLYVDVSDNDGHTYLIKREDIKSFEKELKVLEDKLNFDFNYGKYDYCNDFENLLEYFNAKSLEGEEVFVVLHNDVIKGDEDE